MLKRIFKNRKAKGFTLMETLVSIAIFSIVAVIMTGIIINVGKFSLEHERRNDILSEIDNVANVVRNDIRSSTEVGICGSGSSSKIYRLSSGSYFRLEVSNSRLAWIPVSDANCTFSDPSKADFVSSDEIMQIKSLKVAKSTDTQNGSGIARNSIVFMSVEICSLDNIPDSAKVFDCSLNPYTYFFAVSTRVTV